MTAELEKKLTELVQNELLTTDLVLFSIRVHKGGFRIKVSIVLDYAEGGITLDECAAWNRKISDLIELRQAIQGPYLVEVASPGLDWPLVSERDWRRVKGKEIHLKFKEVMQDSTLETIRIQTGVVDDVCDGVVQIKTREDADPKPIPLKQIILAKLRSSIPQKRTL